jgi:hypothetical protein
MKEISLKRNIKKTRGQTIGCRNRIIPAGLRKPAE